MNKNKTIKVLGAAAIASSAFAATAPVSAASNADALVKAAKEAGTVLKWAISNQGSFDGTNRPYDQFNAAKAALAKAEGAKLSEAQKAQLDDVKTQISRATALIDAVTSGEKIQDQKAILDEQIAIGEVSDELEAAYHTASGEIRKQAILLDRVYGQTTRELVREMYKYPAERVLWSLTDTVSAKMELDKAEAAEDAEVAKTALAKANEYLTAEGATFPGTMKAQLTAKYDQVLDEVEKELTPDVTSVSAVNDTTIKATVVSTMTEEQLVDKKVTLTAGENELKATYVANSLNNGEATFELDGDAKLVDAQSYETTADWSVIENGQFIAKVADAYVAGFEKVTTGISAQTGAAVTFSAVNQYGEPIAVPTSNTTVQVTINGMLLTSQEAVYSNGKVTITSPLVEGDVVSITLTHTDGAETPKVLAKDTLEYTVVKEAAQTVTALSVNPAKTSLPAKEATALNVAVKDQFNNIISDAAVRYVVNGTVVDT